MRDDLFGGLGTIDALFDEIDGNSEGGVVALMLRLQRCLKEKKILRKASKQATCEHRAQKAPLSRVQARHKRPLFSFGGFAYLLWRSIKLIDDGGFDDEAMVVVGCVDGSWYVVCGKCSG